MWPHRVYSRRGKETVELKELLCSRQHKQAHDLCLQMEQESEENGDLYRSFPLFLEMLDSDNAYVRVRGFRLICSQAKWDEENQIERNLKRILNALDDEKPTNVRQCLSVLTRITAYKPNLKDAIRIKLNGLELAKYRDSMQLLIMRDIENVMRIF